jgi:hypothetical protein
MELFVNRRDSDDISNYNTADVISNNTYKYYGKYFALDMSTSSMKLYSSSYENDAHGAIHQIEVTAVCTHEQVYSTSGDSCSSVVSGFLSIGLQETSSTQCSANDDSISYNRMAGESICDYGCPSKNFGKSCEECSTYMTRVGESAGAGYEWYDSSNYKCYTVDSATGDQSCSEYTSCSTCIYSSKCDFNNYACESTSAVIQNDAYSVFEYCSSLGITEHDYTLCGQSIVNMHEFNSTYAPKPTSVSTPKGTLCKYIFGTTTKFTDTFTLTVDDNVELVVKQTTNGVSTSVTATRRVMNSDGERRSLTTTSTYGVTSADSMSIYYIASGDLASATFSASSGKNYYVATASSDGSGSDSGLDSSSSSSSPDVAETEVTDSPVGLIVATIIIVFLMMMIGCCACVWYKCSKVKERNYRDGNGNHVVHDGVQDVLPMEIVQRLSAMREFDFENKCNMFDITNCVICLDDFIPGVKVKQMTFCDHIFHSNCIEEVLRVSHRLRKYKCPLCNTDL